MAHLTMSRAQAFSTGSRVWIVPNNGGNSNLLRRIDWYLNFQLSRARLHKRRSPNTSLSQILTENRMADFFAEQETRTDAPLAVVAGSRLPTDMVVELPYSTPAKWAQAVHAIWRDLGRPHFRVFLPPDLDATQFSKHWPGALSDDFSLVSS